MSFLVSMLLPFLVCFALIACTSVIWWRTLQSPWLFIVVGFLALLGIHRMVQIATEGVKLLRGSGYFMEVRSTPSAAQLMQENLTLEAFAISALVVAFGFPLLQLLKRSLASL